MEEKKTETYEQSIRRRPILRGTGCDLCTDRIGDRDRRDGQQIFYAESCADDYSTDTHLCGALAGKGSAKSQKE